MSNQAGENAPERRADVADCEETEEHRTEEIQPVESEIEIDSDTETSTSLSVISSFQLDPPTLPSFVDQMLVGDLPMKARERLKFDLDVPCVGEALKNWEWMASFFGMTWAEIKYMQERVLYPNSPTLEVLWRFRKENLGRVLRLIRDKLRRYSLIIQLVPILSECHVTEKPSASPPEMNTSVSDADSGIISSYQQDQSSLSSTSQWNWEELRVGNALQIHANWNLENGAPNGPEYMESNPGAQMMDDTKLRVLITFYPDSDEHVKYVRWLERNLRKHGARVTREDSLGTDSAENLGSALEKAFREADQIIPVLSVGYQEAVGALSTGDRESLSDSRGRVSRYFYSQMNAEYVENNSVNLRFRPVIFDGSVRSECVPPLFRNTIVFHWPSMQNDLFKLIFDAPRLFHRGESDNFSLAAQSLISV